MLCWKGKKKTRKAIETEGGCWIELTIELTMRVTYSIKKEGRKEEKEKVRMERRKGIN